MSNQSGSTSGGIGILGVLGVAFIILKLCGVINWSWWWVTAPFWGVFAVVIVGAVAMTAIALVAGAARNAKARK